MLSISEENKVYKLFQLIITVNCMFSSFLYAKLACFKDPVDASGYHHHYSQESLDLIYQFELIVEGLFLLDFILSFFLQYMPQNAETLVPIKDVSKTAMRYFQTGMSRDLIPLIPFHLFFKFRYSRLFYLIKCIRVAKSIGLLDSKRFMYIVKLFQRRILEKKISLNDEVGEDCNNDHNKINLLLTIKYAFQTFKLVIIILMTSYYIGILFYIISEIF